MKQARRQLRRWAARTVYREGPRCFACGRPGPAPCPGHDYGGVITGWTMRRPFRWMPALWFWRVDCRWTLREPARPLIVMRADQPAGKGGQNADADLPAQ